MQQLKQSDFFPKLKKILKFPQNPAKNISNSCKFRIKAKKSSLASCFFSILIEV